MAPPLPLATSAHNLQAIQGQSPKKTQGGSIMSFPTEIWDLQIPLGNYRLSHCNCRDNNRNTLGDASPTTITKLVHFHSPPQVHISTKPNPRAPTKIWVPNFWPTTLVHLTEKDHCRWKFGIPTSWWKFWGHQPRPQGNSSETDPLEEDWCMYVVENYWVHGKCSKFFLGGGGYHDGIGTSGFQWIRNWFSDQTSCFLLTRWI